MIVALRNSLVDAYRAACAFALLTSTASTGTASGTEITGGAPAYARKATAWGVAANGAASFGPLAFDVASGVTVAGAGFSSAVTAGTYQDGGALTSQAFSSQGTYNLSGSFTES